MSARFPESPEHIFVLLNDRDWEDDFAQSFDGVDSNTCDDIAEQLVLNSPGQNLKVMTLFSFELSIHDVTFVCTQMCYNTCVVR